MSNRPVRKTEPNVWHSRMKANRAILMKNVGPFKYLSVVNEVKVLTKLG